jgi:DNA-binding transcriptional ArsR family regulator
MTTEFRPDRPEPDSPWARYCPEAWPREWLVQGRMPDGFTRPATQDEADLITGRISERLFLWRTGRLTAPSPHARTDAASAGPARDPNRRSARRGRSAKRNALVERVTGQRQFFEAATELELSAGAIAVWCWLWTCTRKGQARYTVRRLAERFGVVPSTVSRWVSELTNAGFVETVRRGKPGRSATIVRVRYSPDTQPDGRPR